MTSTARLKPVTSHRLAIEDFTTWRGLFVMSGVKVDAKKTQHIFRSKNLGDGLWFGEIDDLWKLGKPVGRGGPWMNSDVWPSAPSDPYLMTGYDRKTLELSHDCDVPVTFILEHDFLADDSWNFLKKIQVPANQTVVHRFDEGFSTHWVRLIAD